MKTIIHISDLHFGVENKDLALLLTQTINSLAADLVVISGDFTQRATLKEFSRARAFLNSIKSPFLSVPGNHDISFLPWERFIYPFRRYFKFIHGNLNPYFMDEKVMILGVNSATPTRLKNGEITPKELTKIHTFFAADEHNRIKIVVMHHNLIRLKNYHSPIANEAHVIQQLLSIPVDLVLSGHLHFPCIREITTELKIGQRHTLFIITGGTTISTRLRNANNSFNFITLKNQGFNLSVYDYSPHQFQIKTSADYNFLKSDLD